MSVLRGKKRDLVKEFYALKQQEKELKKEIERLRNTIDAEFDFGSFSAGDVTLDIIEKERRTLDAKKVEKLLGDKMKKCYTVSKYMNISVKKAA